VDAPWAARPGAVVANLGPRDFSSVGRPWPWPDVARVAEVARRKFGSGVTAAGGGWVALSLAPFQVRVFRT